LSYSSVVVGLSTSTVSFMIAATIPANKPPMAASLISETGTSEDDAAMHGKVSEPPV